MMRLATLSGIAALACTAPLAAQGASAQDGAAFEPAFTSDEDLDCAIYVGALLAELDEAATPDNRVGLTSAFTYFVGRYEARKGTGLIEAFTARYPAYLDRNPAEIEQTCAIRMRAFASRLQQTGQALTRLEPPVPSENDAPAQYDAPAQNDAATLSD